MYIYYVCDGRISESRHYVNGCHTVSVVTCVDIKSNLLINTIWFAYVKGALCLYLLCLTSVVSITDAWYDGQ